MSIRSKCHAPRQDGGILISGNIEIAVGPKRHAGSTLQATAFCRHEHPKWRARLAVKAQHFASSTKDTAVSAQVEIAVRSEGDAERLAVVVFLFQIGDNQTRKPAVTLAVTPHLARIKREGKDPSVRTLLHVKGKQLDVAKLWVWSSFTDERIDKLAASLS